MNETFVFCNTTNIVEVLRSRAPISCNICLDFDFTVHRYVPKISCRHQIQLYVYDDDGPILQVSQVYLIA